MSDWMPTLEKGVGPRYLTLAEAILADVAAGRLAPGSRMPNQRELARVLGTSVGTVTRAYQAAEARGAIHSTPGRGTFVRRLPSAGSPLGSTLALDPGRVDLSVAHPLYAQEPDLARALSSMAADVDVHRLFRYQALAEDPRYRTAGLAWLAECGVNAEVEGVVITSGGQHGCLTLVLALTRPGELIMVDEVTYPGFLSLAQQTRRRVRGIPMDAEGMIPEALDEACEEEDARALYLIPTLHNPTGILMPDARRQALAEVAENRGLQVIEDDTLRLLASDPPPTVTSFVPDRSFFIGSMSKAVSGGLRLAFIRVPNAHGDLVRAAVGATVFMASPLLVELGARWIEDGTARHTVAKKRTEIEARQELARELLPAGSFQAHCRSYYLWLYLTEGWTSAEFEAEGRRRGVGVAASRPFSVNTVRPPDAVRVCLSAAEDRDALAGALLTLDRMLADPGSRAPGLL